MEDYSSNILLNKITGSLMGGAVGDALGYPVEFSDYDTSAIAIYYCLKYPDDFEKAIITSVNHGGDSDSTGAVTGNILGAWVGYDAIHPKFTDYLEEVDTIEDISQRLYSVEN